MNTHTPAPDSTPHADADAWAEPLFEQLLQGNLAPSAFEAKVSALWQQAAIVYCAPRTAARLCALAMQSGQADGGYASDAPHLGFVSQWLAGTPGQPGAVHIQSPPEQYPDAGLARLNRPLHQHDSARIALITRGEAVFHVKRPTRQGHGVMAAYPVREGDLIVWPAWTAHTFHAGKGFWLVTAMEKFVSPGAEGFMLPIAPEDAPL